MAADRRFEYNTLIITRGNSLCKTHPDERSHVKYRQTSDIRRTLVGNKVVDHSDAVVRFENHR